MVSKNITITKEAYEYLQSLKGERSFSETILSLRSGSDILRYAGIFKDVDLSAVEQVREEANRGWKNRR
jgi:predicted CopG family antitoxin